MIKSVFQIVLKHVFTWLIDFIFNLNKSMLININNVTNKYCFGKRVFERGDLTHFTFHLTIR